MFLYLGNDVHIIANLSVRKKACDTNVISGVGWIQCRPDRLHHLSSPISLATV